MASAASVTEDSRCSASTQVPVCSYRVPIPVSTGTSRPCQVGITPSRASAARMISSISASSMASAARARPRAAGEAPGSASRWPPAPRPGPERAAGRSGAGARTGGTWLASAAWAASAGAAPRRMSRCMCSSRVMSSAVYRRCRPGPSSCAPMPYRRFQVRSVDGATPSRRATAPTLNPTSSAMALPRT